MHGQINGQRCWTKEEAWEWYTKQPWLLGFNFLPSTAVNSTEMWQEESFDIETIEKELKWASDIGYNTCRVFLQYLVWKADAKGLKDRIGRFLAAAVKYGISTALILFDDCNFDNREPFLGVQLEPIPGVHNSRWTPSPGFTAVDNNDEWYMLERYVKDIVGTFAIDERVVIWDLYNEPGNSKRREKSTSLIRNAFKWAREINPSQPLTSGAWNWNEMSEPELVCFELSDIINFHCYSGLEFTQARVNELKQYGRPIICTEWLLRQRGSTFESHLPFFKEENIGIYNWGLVCGKTQTNLHWETMRGTPNPNPDIWQHDILYKDGTPYRNEEIELIRKLSPRNKTIILKPVEMTAEIMQMLEDRGLIYRLCPGHHELDTKPGETLGQSIYEGVDTYGPHKLITVTVNRTELAGFGTHPDNEDFLLIGDPNTKPMYLVIALCMREELDRKIADKTLTEYDFVSLKVKYNDPQVGFFTMLKDVPHGEAIAYGEGKPPSFYVTEPSDMGLDITDFKECRIKVNE